MELVARIVSCRWLGCGGGGDVVVTSLSAGMVVADGVSGVVSSRGDGCWCVDVGDGVVSVVFVCVVIAAYLWFLSCLPFPTCSISFLFCPICRATRTPCFGCLLLEGGPRRMTSPSTSASSSTRYNTHTHTRMHHSRWEWPVLTLANNAYLIMCFACGTPHLLRFHASPPPPVRKLLTQPITSGGRRGGSSCATHFGGFTCCCF